MGRYEALGGRFIHELWSLPFSYWCERAEKEVLLTGKECDSSVGHSIVSKHVTIHCACNASVVNLACFLKGIPAPSILPLITVISNGSYLMLSDQDCCGMKARVLYILSVTQIVTCCNNMLFPPTHTVSDCSLWPSIPALKADFNKLSRLKALLFQKHVALHLPEKP